jgi:hypothetical protein
VISDWEGACRASIKIAVSAPVNRSARGAESRQAAKTRDRLESAGIGNLEYGKSLEPDTRINELENDLTGLAAYNLCLTKRFGTMYNYPVQQRGCG